MPRRSDHALHRAIGARVASLRVARGLTQEDLAAKASIEPMTVSRVERGERSLSLANMAAVAEALGVRLPVLVDVEPEEAPTADESEWRALWAQLSPERRALAIRVVRALVPDE